MRSTLGLALLIVCFHSSVSQSLTDDMMLEEEKFQASTKQIGQFFKRFNGEENKKGDRLYPKDKHYRSTSLRKKYLPLLFDENNPHLDEALAKKFIQKVNDKTKPKFLDFHANNWIAEVHTTFSQGSKEVAGLLYMKLQRQGKGYEWVMDDVSFDRYKTLFDKDTSENKKFLHPMSHELGFMNLRKAMQNADKQQFTSRAFQADQLSVFIYELNQNILAFKTVERVILHFFSIDGWYFSVSYFNRPGYNSGWLIENLVEISSPEQKKAMEDYVYDKDG